MNLTLVSFFVGLAAVGAAIGVAMVALLHVARLQRELAQRLDLLPALAELKDAEGRLDGVRRELEGLRQSVGAAQRLVAEADAVRAELEVLRQSVAELEPRRAELRVVQEQLSQAQTRLEQVLRELTERRSELARAESDSAAAAAKLAQLRHDCMATEQALATAKVELAATQAERADAERMRVALQSQVRELTADRDRLAAQVGALQGQVSQLTSELSQLERRIADAKRELEAARAEESRSREQVASLKSEITRLERNRDDAERELDGVRARLAEMAPSMTPDRRFAAVFEQPPLSGKADAGSITESAALERVKEHSSRCGFVYAPRVINAFHTSLKIDGKAPLMVLAGISGTGKTQLPRIYADALGIHFLPIAVQPGWDSPQDLIGFFSHLEGRFRPTPLLQALVQMDPYIGSEVLKPDHMRTLRELWQRHSCADQMLLVLLDEMNLARVEYYFSDFLSRLELRNSPGFDSRATNRRDRASILLEGGPGSQGIAVFPGHNVLFVGTMNEDESTQSLSDKVVDRANVLRFGTPRKLETAVARDLSALGPVQKNLSKDTWRSWQIDVQPERIRVGGRPVSEWIADLNEALKRVNRPFGHRTAGAITEYVGQYPESQSKDSAAKNALADQIEQRIMPKLRGLDPQSSEAQQLFGILHATVDALDDPALREAIERGETAHDGAQFVWFGVDRGTT
jgi:predicted  nucleic acid-binding Zn-ribbon protein